MDGRLKYQHLTQILWPQTDGLVVRIDPKKEIRLGLTPPMRLVGVTVDGGR